MKTTAGTPLHPALRAFPGAVVELSSPDGVVLDSNGVLERRLERELAGRPLAEALDAPSRAKLERILAHIPEADEAPSAWELMVEGKDTFHPHAFYPLRAEGEDGRVWLVEIPRDPRLAGMYDELNAVSSEQALTQRQLAKEKARLGRALDELERESGENSRLSRTLQAQNEEMEAQNEELLAMTEELHAGQEQLLQLNHQLERRTRELQLALSARNRFYASMSHELRTPINAVMGYNDLLLASVYGPLNEQQELAIERSQRAAQHLRELVDDVLDLSRLEAGREVLEVQTVELKALVEEAFEALHPAADATGTPLHVAGAEGCTVRTDPRRARQVIAHLVSNAVKFGKGAPVVVRCRRERSGEVVVEVTDGGPGIPTEDLIRIFDEFVQLERDENGDSSGVDGTGLGLPIARRMARLLGGDVEASSTEGVGSTFRLVLPAAPPLPRIGPKPEDGD
jgi:signal transduction histidine kinase